MKVNKEIFPTKYGEVTWVRLTSEDGASVTLSSLGAGIVAVEVPDKEGNNADVVLGYRDPANFMADGPCFGKTPGRFANRIAKGHFTLDGKEYTLAINNGPNALHGGPTGFQNHIWNTEVTPEGKVVFTLLSPAGDEGYPGTLKATVTYEWTEDHVLKVHYEAVTDAPTVVNLTNHAYFNLDGENDGKIFKHKLQLNANHYLPTDETQIPTGDFMLVNDSPMDFREAKEIGRDIEADFFPLKVGKGYDHCWVLNDWEPGKMVQAAVLEAPKSGRVLEVFTDQPGVQVYTGNWLAGCPQAKTDKDYEDYDGVALECQGFPDAPNHENFPTSRLNPGEVYERNIEFRFK